MLGVWGGRADMLKVQTFRRKVSLAFLNVHIVRVLNLKGHHGGAAGGREEVQGESGVGKSTNSKTPNISLVFILYKEQDECICTVQCTEYCTKPSCTVRDETVIKYCTPSIEKDEQCPDLEHIRHSPGGEGEGGGCLVAQDIRKRDIVNNSFILKSSTEISYK